MVDTLFFQNGSIQYKGSFRGGTIHGYGVHYYQGQVLFTPHHALLKRQCHESASCSSPLFRILQLESDRVHAHHETRLEQILRDGGATRGGGGGGFSNPLRPLKVLRPKIILRNVFLSPLIQAIWRPRAWNGPPWSVFW